MKKIKNRFTEDEINRIIGKGIVEIKIFSVLHYVKPIEACWIMWTLSKRNKNLDMITILAITLNYLFVECNYRKRLKILKLKK